MITTPSKWLPCALGVVSLLQGVSANGPSYTPLRPPALPLAVRNPYTNIWSTASSHGETLNSKAPTFWTMNPVGWEGMVAVDDVTYEYLGNANNTPPGGLNYTSAVPLNVSFDSQSSNFMFQAGPVTINARFLSPVFPVDVCRSSIPLSYLVVTVRSTDGNPHHIQLYSDVSSKMLTGNTGDPIFCELTKNDIVTNSTHLPLVKGEDVFTWKFHRQNSVLFGEADELPTWGNFTYTTGPLNASSFSYAYGEENTVRAQFCQNHTLANVTLSPLDNTVASPVFAFAHDFGVVNQTTVRYTIGSVQDPIIQYLTDDGVKELRPWWRNCFGDLHSMIQYHFDNYWMAESQANAFEMQLRADIDSFYGGKENPVNSSTPLVFQMPPNGTDQYGQPFELEGDTDSGFLDPANWTGVAAPFVSEAQAYYSIVALSARQIMGSYVFAVSPDPNNPDPLGFVKEISSDGNVNTVDVLYPATPFFLYTNPNLLRYALQPLNEYQEGKLLNRDFCIHDLGAHFPNATGHINDTNEEMMPLEESGDFILMSFAYYKFTGDIKWLASHYKLLNRFAGWLVKEALVPANQLSTDDFAGKLQNQSSLAIKGIVGLKAMSYMAMAAGEPVDGTNYDNMAKSYYDQWEALAIDPSHNHTMLAYQWRSSWSLLYNIYFDKLFNMGVVREELYTMQSDWYATVSQLYGVPLDNRHAYTKTDWQIWTAATCHAGTRRLFINSIAYWLSQGGTDGPFTDLYQCTGTGTYDESIQFKARPVVGGHFALLALGKTGQKAFAEAGNMTGSLFDKDSAKPLPSPAVIQPASFGTLASIETDGLQENVTTVLSGSSV